MPKPINYTARFETVGDLYYRHSGRLRPGKSKPPETGRDSSDPENQAAFDEWMATLCFGQALDRIAELEAKVERLEATIEETPRAFVDSDTARACVVVSTPALPELAAREAGDAGSNPAREGSAETSAVTAGAIPVAGAERFIPCLQSGDLKWYGSTGESRAEVDETIALAMRSQVPGFADRYRIEHCVVVSPGEWVPFVGTGKPHEEGPV